MSIGDKPVDDNHPCDQDNEKGPRVATREDLVALLHSLSDHLVDYVLLGGQALNLHGYMRGTSDIDLLLPMDEVNGRRVVDALSILPDNAAKDVDPKWLTESGTVRVADEIVVDLMTVAANGETYESLKSHIQKREENGFSFFLLDLEGLLKTKKSVRPKDIQDADVIRSMLSRMITCGAENAMVASATEGKRPTGFFGLFRNTLGNITASNLERDFHNALIPRLSDPAQQHEGDVAATVRALVKDANMNAFALVEVDGKAFAAPISDADRDRLSPGQNVIFRIIHGERCCATVPPQVADLIREKPFSVDATKTHDAGPD